jgi:hypothetical protein
LTVRPPPNGAEALYWVIVAAIVGFAAGIPWAWMLYGILPAMAFSVISAAYAVVSWRAPRAWSGGRAAVGTLVAAFGWGGATGAVVSLTFGRVGSYTWLDLPARDCFHLHGEPVIFFGDNIANTLSAGLCTAGFVMFGSVACWLRGRASWRARWTGAGAATNFWIVEAAVCLLASLGWSLANETIGGKFDSKRDICNPDVGIFAIAGYAVSALGFGFALVRAAGSQRPARSALRIVFAAFATFGCVGLLAVQTGRSLLIRSCAAPWKCGCATYGDGNKAYGGGTGRCENL